MDACLSTGPKTLEGLARLRAAHTTHGRYSAEGLAFLRWYREHVADSYRSALAMPDARMRAHFLHLASQEISPYLLERMRQWAREEVIRQDVERLRAKGLEVGDAEEE